MKAARRVGRVITVGLVCASLALGAVGCARTASAPPKDPQVVFDALVLEADAAREAGDATKAYELYSRAVETTGAADAAGEVAGKREAAKRLMLTRVILATTVPAVNTLAPYVQALVYSASESTESVAARNGLVDCLDDYPRLMRDEITVLRKDIQAGRGSTMPHIVSLVQTLAGGWETEVKQAPGQTGIHLTAAVKAMKAAADSVESAFDSKYVDDALVAVKSAEAQLKKADAEFKLARAGD